MPGGKSYVERYKKRVGGEVEQYSPYAYDGTMAVLNAMKQADSVDPRTCLPVLKATQMKGVTTNELAYVERGDLKQGGVTVCKVTNGK
jgi:branched-chain amino acid transport system substrate-binding protein